VNDAIAAAFREEWGRIVASVIAVTGDWDLAEECTQDAFTKALARWPTDGVPRRPGAWLTTVARNRARDRLRRAAVETGKLQEVAVMSMMAELDEPADDTGIGDDRLRLIFTCCHPALAVEAQVALTLRILAGLSTAEIARAFLIEEPTLAKRLVRAKAKIRNARIPYRVPPAHLLPERTSGVLAVLYLLFNEGYAATAGAELVRDGLAAEAIRLARLLARLMPDEPEALGLLALMLFHHARRPSRTDETGDLVTLADQDRTAWDAAAIADGIVALTTAVRRGEPGPYQLQAAIAATHCEAATADDTDWPRIVWLYDQLVELIPSPVVELNRAVAVAMIDGPAAGLRLVDDLAAGGDLDRYHLLAATRADLLRRLDRRADAATEYRNAVELATNQPERRYLLRRLAEVTQEK
jgi:RNA polymerase sigma-70 factor (ECF subfamily)